MEEIMLKVYGLHPILLFPCKSSQTNAPYGFSPQKPYLEPKMQHKRLTAFPLLRIVYSQGLQVSLSVSCDRKSNVFP